MRITLLIALLFAFAGSHAQAQTRLIGFPRFPLESRQAEFGSAPEERPELSTAARLTDDDPTAPLGKNESSTKLPETPKPKLENKEVSPCTKDGKRCAASGRQLDYQTPFHMDEPDKSWREAMGHPLMWTTSSLLVGLTVKQLVKTDRCINANKPACNLVFRKNRAATYAVNIPLTAAMIWKAGKLKKDGKGTNALLLIGFNLMFQEVVSHTANPNVLTCQPNRTPQCQ